MFKGLFIATPKTALTSMLKNFDPYCNDTIITEHSDILKKSAIGLNPVYEFKKK